MAANSSIDVPYLSRNAKNCAGWAPNGSLGGLPHDFLKALRRDSIIKCRAVFSAKTITMDPNLPSATHVAVLGDRILAVGVRIVRISGGMSPMRVTFWLHTDTRFCRRTCT